MNAAENKQVLERAFAAMATGDGGLFVDALGDDVRWTLTGANAWSGVYEGKAAVLRDLLRPLAAQFDGANTVSATRMIAEGDIVVVEAQNHSRTKAGEAYPNRYCFVVGFRDGKVAKIVEYCDTEPVAKVLGDPGAVRRAG